MYATTPPYAVERPARDPGFVTGAAYGALAVLGAMLALIGSFEFSWEAGGVPVAAILLSVVNLGAFRAGGWAMGGKLGALVMALPWLIVVVVLSSRRPEGDLVVTGTTPGYVFIFGGAIAAVVAIAWTRSERPWMPVGVPPAPGVRS